MLPVGGECCQTLVSFGSLALRFGFLLGGVSGVAAILSAAALTALPLPLDFSLDFSWHRLQPLPKVLAACPTAWC